MIPLMYALFISFLSPVILVVFRYVLGARPEALPAHRRGVRGEDERRVQALKREHARACQDLEARLALARAQAREQLDKRLERLQALPEKRHVALLITALALRIGLLAP